MKTVILLICTLALFACKKDSDSAAPSTTTPGVTTIKLREGYLTLSPTDSVKAYPSEGSTIELSGTMSSEYGYFCFTPLPPSGAASDLYTLVISTNSSFQDTVFGQYVNVLKDAERDNSHVYGVALITIEDLKNDPRSHGKLYWRWVCSNPQGSSVTHSVYFHFN